MAIQLYPHNQETYEKMTKMFKTSNRVGAVQPTGTGKSFLMLKWIEDHPDDSFIVISPSLEIFMQLVGYAKETDDEDLLKSVLMISYQTLIRMSNEEIANQHATKIIVDEFHRAGANLWGPALLKLLDTNPQAKVFGTSATPVRYLDNSRDMAYELFDRNLAVEMTLGDAINRKILPTPKYLGVWFDFDGRLIQLEKDISYIKDPKKRNEKVRQFRRMKQQLEDSFGAHKIFREHMPKNGKFIVFCRDREHLDEMTRKMHAWLSGVNLNLHWYVSISERKDKDLQLQAFKDDEDIHAVKLLYTIDRFNEGLHVKGIDGVIMLRPTISPIIYLQQLGRAFATGGKPAIVFDFVNNFGNVKVSFGGMQSSNPLEEQINNSPFKIDIDSYSILGQAKAVASILQEMDESLSWSFEKQWLNCFYLYQSFKREFGREPKDNEIYRGVNLGKWVRHQREAAKRGVLSEDRERKLLEAGFVFDVLETAWQKNYELYIAFKAEFRREPKYKEIYQDVRLGIWCSNQRQRYRRGEITERQKQKLLEAGFIFNQKEAAWQETYHLCIEFKEKFGREPQKRETYGDVKLGLWLQTQRDLFKKGILSEERKQQLLKAGFILDPFEDTWKKTFNLYIALKTEFGREPNRNEIYQGVKLGIWCANQRTAFKNGTLSEERKQKLLEAGFVFKSPSTNKAPVKPSTLER